MESAGSSVRGSIAGASGDAGVEYRRGVAAYTAALGLAGVPLPVAWLAPESAVVSAISLETDDAVDDIRIDFSSGSRAFVQAKRTLTAGKPLEQAVAQWVKAARSGLDPRRDRLVIVAGALTGSTRRLQQALERGRTDLPGSPTRAELHALNPVLHLLSVLGSEQRQIVLRCAAIWELDVEEPEDAGSQQAIAYLRHIVEGGRHADAVRAWSLLTARAGRAARLRGGLQLAGWLDFLTGKGVAIGAAGSTCSAQLELRRRALARFAERTIREGSAIDLRPLGAALPPVPLDVADAEIQVGADPHDYRDDRPLAWAFLRRGRAVLTGLPGGGKSTALRQLAAQLVSDPSLPLPVYVSLREVDTSSSHAGLRDQLIELALRDASPADRAPLADEINARLDGSGPIALLLDSLDETYERSPTVVAMISRLEANVARSVCVLLATREVAYKQADTLGWPCLLLGPPASIYTTVTAILEAAGRQYVDETAARADWVKARMEWVVEALDLDDELVWTPLMPVLLSLLAIERSTGHLPTSRAAILKEVAESFLASHELRLERDRGLVTLPDSVMIRSVGLQAFVTEAATVMASRGQATERQVVDAVTFDLQESWGFSSGQARVVAQDAIRLLDEAGIFVLSHPGAPVVPRIMLLAEVGDAVHVADHPEMLARWVAQRIAAEQFVPLALACELIPDSLPHAAAILCAGPSNAHLAGVLAEAAADGAGLDEGTLRVVCRTLIDQVADVSHRNWQAWDQLIALPVPDDLLADLQAAAAQHGPESSLVARATTTLRFGVATADDVDLLKAVLELRGRSTYGPQGLVHEASLLDLQVDAATWLLDNVPATLPVIVERALDDAPYGTYFDHRSLHRPLARLLADRGFADEAQSIREAAEARRPTSSAPSPHASESDFMRLLELIAAGPQADLSTIDTVLLGELADFLETLELYDRGSTLLLRSPEALISSAIDVATSLCGFDRQVLAAQGSIALERMRRWGGMDPYNGLFDQVQARHIDWARIDDTTDVLDVLIEMLMLNLGQAAFASRALQNAPDTVAEIAIPQLRELLPRLETVPDHQMLCALAIASLDAAPDAWATEENPVLRAVAARVLGSNENSYRLFLDDPDGHVRESAIDRLVEAAPSDLVVLLEEIQRQPTPGWMCRGCRTSNPALGGTYCSARGCHRRGADPAELAAKYADKISESRPAPA